MGPSQCRAWQTGPVVPPPQQEQAARGTKAVPALGIEHLLGDKARPRPGLDMGLWVGAWISSK